MGHTGFSTTFPLNDALESDEGKVARMKRRKFETPVIWHVMARGARRLGIHWDDRDFEMFLALLRDSAEASSTGVIGYTLMTNHYHLILEATSLGLTACMRRLDYGYSRYHNEKHNLSGHTFDGPYQRYVQPTARLALSKLAYVFLNPVRAGMVVDAARYRWSNIADYAGGEEPPLSVDPTFLMGKIAGSFSEGQTLFRRAMDLELSRTDRRSPGLPSVLEIQGLHYEWLRDLAKERQDLLAGEDPHLIAMLWARNCGVSPAAIARIEGESTGRGISQKLWRLRDRLMEAGALDRLLQVAS
jgi:putative transposase